MDFASIKARLGEQTTIQGLMCVAGGALWGVLHNDWATGGTFIGLGAIGIVMRETPAQVVAMARNIVAQAKDISVQADTVKAEAQAIVATKAPDQAKEIIKP